MFIRSPGWIQVAEKILMFEYPYIKALSTHVILLLLVRFSIIIHSTNCRKKHDISETEITMEKNIAYCDGIRWAIISNIERKKCYDFPGIWVLKKKKINSYASTLNTSTYVINRRILYASVRFLNKQLIIITQQ